MICSARAALYGIFLAAVLILGTIHAASAQALSLANVRNWAIQLEGANYAEIAKSNYDMVIVDYGLIAKQNIPAISRETIQQLQYTPTGARRIVLAYFSIGEAEDYRYYWQDIWMMNKPEWLGNENPDWPGNYPVRYWYPEWQAKLFGNPDAYLDRILAAGFDGVFLDGVDKVDVWKDQFPSAKNDMIDLVSRVAAYGREHHPGFLVMPQNADELLEDKRFVQVIDAIGREELLYGEKEPEARNEKDSVDYAVAHLQRMRKAGKPVFVIEYLKKPELAASALLELKILDFVGYIANRDLNVLTSPATDCAPPGCSQ